MRKRILISFLLCGYLSYAQGQQASHADFVLAKEINVNKTYTFKESPKGFGKLREFDRSSYRSSYYFEEERNSVWLSIPIPVSGVLEFEISPHSSSDDYDWMLFYNDKKLLANSIKQYPTLLRSNNSRNDKSLKGKTGIRSDYLNLFESPGPGRSFSKALSVKAGDKLALIIDNIYDGGAGFDFKSQLKIVALTKKMIEGTVHDASTKQALAGCRIVCEDDSSGIQLAETSTDKEGNYKLLIPANRPLNLTALNKEYLFETRDIRSSDSTKQHFYLQKPGFGSSLMLFNIHFAPDRDLIRPNSEPELDRLIEILNVCNNYNVDIVGHTNSNPFADVRYLQKLSFNRALAVQHYLVENGIPEKRISSFGMGGKKPLVVTRNVEEGLKNLRVEVVLRKGK